MKMRVEQRSTIKLFVLNRKSNKEAIDTSLKAYGYKAIEKTAIYRWYVRFQETKELPMITAAVAENYAVQFYILISLCIPLYSIIICEYLIFLVTNINILLCLKLLIDTFRVMTYIVNVI
jgi:hypothetical protein